MSSAAPTFTGYTASESIIAFLEEFDLFAATKNLSAERQRAVLEAALRGPAKALFQQRIADGIIATGAGHPEHLANCKAWLRAQYHTEDMRQGLKDQLSETYQSINESPLAFYTTI